MSGAGELFCVVDTIHDRDGILYARVANPNSGVVLAFKLNAARAVAEYRSKAFGYKSTIQPWTPGLARYYGSITIDALVREWGAF